MEQKSVRKKLVGRKELVRKETHGSHESTMR
jgi:hypothetical protein